MIADIVVLAVCCSFGSVCVLYAISPTLARMFAPAWRAFVRWSPIDDSDGLPGARVVRRASTGRGRQ